ncbi:MAG: hypothetical protein IIA45_08900 [Bacteroidetes bacterium]|nr:hypothetical protein [Bacteroidota bacterium]
MVFKLRLTKRLIYLVILFHLISCVNTYKLSDGISRVPSNSKVYKNKSKFNISLLNTIDTSVVYEKYSIRYNILARMDNHPETSIYGVYRFYPGGYFNYFVLDRDIALDIKDFDPVYTGYRGVYYHEKNEIRYDNFGISNGLGWIGKLTGAFTFIGDTLYKKSDYSSYVQIYIKRELPKEYLKYRVDW